MKTNDQGASIPQTGEANSLPTGSRPVQLSGRVHRQYRYICIHLPLLLPYIISSLYSINPHAFGFVFNSRTVSSCNPFELFALPNALQVIPFNRPSSNADRCLYSHVAHCFASVDSTIRCGASGLEVDRGVDRSGSCCLDDQASAAVRASFIFITRCLTANSAVSKVVASVFTRCGQVVGQEGRFA